MFLQMTMLEPMLALVVWTFVIWFWMYATRIPAMRAAKIDITKPMPNSALSALPLKVNQVADNYNHLHEQPTVFYALCVYTHLVGQGDLVNVVLAWAYVAIRIAHSLIQCTTNYIPLRFYVFATGSLCLMGIAVRDVIALFLHPVAVVGA
jgi:hypothetical protein